MTVFPLIETLAMLKMQKNITAVMEKNFPCRPYESYSINDLYSFVKREMIELDNVINADIIDRNKAIFVMNEIADVSNCLDYLYEKFSQLRHRNWKNKDE